MKPSVTIIIEHFLNVQCFGCSLLQSSRDGNFREPGEVLFALIVSQSGQSHSAFADQHPLMVNVRVVKFKVLLWVACLVSSMHAFGHIMLTSV